MDYFKILQFGRFAQRIQPYWSKSTKYPEYLDNKNIKLKNLNHIKVKNSKLKVRAHERKALLRIFMFWRS